MAVSKNTALRKAADVIAREAKDISSRFSKRIPRSFQTTVKGSTATISAGGAEAPNARMFETPGARHPLFGNERRWYTQPYRPFLEEAAEAKGDEAMKVFADEMIDKMLKDSGV